MESAILQLELVSAGPGGHSQRFKVELMWRRYPEGSPEDAEGVLSRALGRYLEPRDLRQASILVVKRRGAVDDQYVYLRSYRRVRRLNMSGQNVFGTDFAVEDLVPRGLFYASYRRVADDVVDGRPCFVVEALFRKQVETQYSRGLFYVEQEHFVPLLVRYWDLAGVEVKKLVIDPDSIREIEGLHVPTRMRVQSVLNGSYTDLRITRLVVNPAIPATWFSVRHLEENATGGIPNSYYAGAHVFTAGREQGADPGRGAPGSRPPP